MPWKTLKNIIEYYYMWKTTDRYVQQKRVKAVEAESKLKQVYIPNYTKPNQTIINNNKGVLNGSSNGSNGNNDVLAMNGGKPCESCSSGSSAQVNKIIFFFTFESCKNIFIIFFSLSLSLVVCLGSITLKLSFMSNMLAILEEIWWP